LRFAAPLADISVVLTALPLPSESSSTTDSDEQGRMVIFEPFGARRPHRPSQRTRSQRGGLSVRCRCKCLHGGLRASDSSCCGQRRREAVQRAAAVDPAPVDRRPGLPCLQICAGPVIIERDASTGRCFSVAAGGLGRRWASPDNKSRPPRRTRALDRGSTGSEVAPSRDDKRSKPSGDFRPQRLSARLDLVAEGGSNHAPAVRRCPRRPCLYGRGLGWFASAAPERLEQHL
jgi:hypothetical protein